MKGASNTANNAILQSPRKVDVPVKQSQGKKIDNDNNGIRRDLLSFTAVDECDAQ